MGKDNPLYSEENESLFSSSEQSENQEEKPAEDRVEPTFVTVPEEEWDRLKGEAWEYKDKYLRMLAEVENTRKRLQKDGQELVQYAVRNIVVDFLNPIDQMENALKYAQQMSEEVKNWAFGFQMVLTQFKDVLANNGVFSFKSEGMPFDPYHHEAIEMVETREFPPGMVILENLRGYKMGDKVIRPARVVVAKAPIVPQEEQQQSKSC